MQKISDTTQNPSFLLTFASTNQAKLIHQRYPLLSEESLLHTDQNGNNALHLACQHGAIEAAVVLSQNGPDLLLEHKNHNGLIPILSATYSVRQQLLKQPETNNLNLSLQKEVATTLKNLIDLHGKATQSKPGFFQGWFGGRQNATVQRYKTLRQAVTDYWVQDRYQGVLDSVYECFCSLTDEDIAVTSPFFLLLADMGKNTVLQHALGLQHADISSLAQAEAYQIAVVRRLGERYALPQTVATLNH